MTKVITGTKTKTSTKTMKIQITTKTGDSGESGLANGERLSKGSAVFEVIGTLDELNSWLGLVAAKLETSFASDRDFIFVVQDKLFYVGAELAKSPKAKLGQRAVDALEAEADKLQELLADNWHTKFILPGGTEIGGYLDVARTVCRRSERLVVAYSAEELVSPIVLRYVNRLSDYLYLLRCFVNQQQEYLEKEFEV